MMEQQFSGQNNSNRLLLSLVNRLCSTLIPSESDNFDKVCRYSLDLISQKRIKIEDCEEQYLLSKIRHSFLKESKLTEWSVLEDLYLKLKSSPSKSVNVGELLYCLFLLSKSNSTQNSTIFSITNRIEGMKINKNEIDLDHNSIPNSMNGINLRKVTNPIRHTVHGYINENNFNYNQTSKYNILAKDLIFIFQGLHGKHISFQNEKFSIKIDGKELFYPNEIYFAKRLSILGQNFKIIKTYSATAINNTSKGFVVQSFGSALNDEINDFYRLMTSIQANFHKNNTSSVTLHNLNIWTFESFICFDALVNLIGKCRSKKGGALISVVYDMMHHGDPIVRECIRKILSKVVKPIRKMLNHWIFYGELKDEYKEFFIAFNENTQIATSLSNVFWYDQYSINKSMLPGFIRKQQAFKILITGKAISMLREVSMNKVSVVLPLYDQLKNSFENSNLETLFDQKYSYQANEFAGLLDYVYKEISQTALQILNAKYILHQHFIAHKRFLLFEQGDFIDYLMEILYPIINKPGQKIRVYTLSQTLESAIRKTNAQYESSDILSRIDIFFDQNNKYENCWDIFTLKYHVDGPIGTIFNEQSQVIYSKLFKLFWKIKTIEFSLNKCWINLKFLSRKIDPSLEFFKTIFKHFHYLLYQILSFIKTIEKYYDHLIESCWNQVKNELDQPRNLNKLIKVHQMFLQNLFRKLFLDNLTAQHNVINKLFINFQKKLETFFVEITNLLENNIEDAWDYKLKESEEEIDTNYNFWLHNFSRLLQKEISLFLELLVDSDEDDLRELCFSIDFNKYYKMQQF